jgi:putative alpha-1,2-mannosidase
VRSGRLNYIPADRVDESVSKTFEYCYDDWAIAHVARRLGKTDDAAMLVKRSTNYRNYFDSSVASCIPSWSMDRGPRHFGLSI